MKETIQKNTSRYASLDVLRGIFLLIMATNHLYRSWLHVLTDQPLGYVSAAEGFVFLSGLVVGLVYSKRWEQKGGMFASQALLKRGMTVYGVHLLSCAVIVAWGWGFLATQHVLPVRLPQEWFLYPKYAMPFTFLLLYQPGLLDVLPTYVMLLWASPLIFWLLNRGYGKWLISGSVLMWGLTNLWMSPHPMVAYQGAMNTGAFTMTSWQLIYVVGLSCGFAWYRGTLPKWEFAWWKIGLLAGILCLLSMCSHMTFDIGQGELDWFVWYNKNNLGPLRMYNFAVLALMIHYALKKWSLHCAPLELLGRYSLQVFATHSVVAMVIFSFPELFEHTRFGPSLALVVMFASMWAMAWCCEKRREIKASAAKS